MTSPLDKIINELADSLREGIAEIESNAPTTRGHYGTYMAIISTHAADAGQARILARALIKAGANEQGVNDALRICYPR